MELENKNNNILDDLDLRNRNWSNIQHRLDVLDGYILKDIDSFEDVQRIVRMGLADKVFTVGDQFTATYNGIPYLWDVIGINHDTPSDKRFKHSMTIQAHDVIMNAQFDAPEPDNPDENIKLYGYNNYLKSNIRQFLNSDEATFKWVSQHAHDVASTGAPYNGPGFLKLLDPELVSVLGKVDKQVARNTVTDGGGQDVFSDKVFLLSRKEVYGGDEGTVTGENPYEYYAVMASAPTAEAVDWRIKYLRESPRYWWLRSPYVGYSSTPHSVYPNGVVADYFAFLAGGIAPACTII